MPVISNSIPKVLGVAFPDVPDVPDVPNVPNVLVASAILSSIVVLSVSAVLVVLVLILIFVLSVSFSACFFFSFLPLPLRLCVFCGVNPCGGWFSVSLPFTPGILTLNKKPSTGRMAVKHSKGKGLARRRERKRVLAGAGGCGGL